VAPNFSQLLNESDKRINNSPFLIISLKRLSAQKLIISQIEAIERRLAFIKNECAVVMHGKKYNGKYPYQVNLDNIKERVRKLTGKEEHVIVKNIIDIQNKLMNQFLDVEMASSELGAYIQDL
jgi:hypothetical protein